MDSNIKYYRYNNGSTYRVIFVGDSSVIGQVQVYKDGYWKTLPPSNWVRVGFERKQEKLFAGWKPRRYIKVPVVSEANPIEDGKRYLTADGFVIQVRFSKLPHYKVMADKVWRLIAGKLVPEEHGYVRTCWTVEGIEHFRNTNYYLVVEYVHPVKKIEG